MYQAIVFLPLLGAIIAGAIALVGAWQRVAGGAPVGHDHGHSHATAHEAEHTHDAHDDHHAPQEPAAMGSRAAEVITTSFLFVAMVLSWIAFARVGFGHYDERVALFTWIVSGDLKVDWALRIDTLTAVMLVVVTTVSALVHLYSVGYMAEEPYRPRFFPVSVVFHVRYAGAGDGNPRSFSSLGGRGLASYLLIDLVPQAQSERAAIKAFVVNRIGDFGLRRYFRRLQ